MVGEAPSLSFLPSHFCPGVAERGGAIEDGLAWLSVDWVDVKVTVALELVVGAWFGAG